MRRVVSEYPANKMTRQSDLKADLEVASQGRFSALDLLLRTTVWLSITDTPAPPEYRGSFVARTERQAEAERAITELRAPACLDRIN